ncbi:hypothetical protein ACIA8E_39545, partial [Streptomyces sp. NPDC051664]|uniref:hypothetical protein n=1 Tax=Streptomyces sp. NPDC051664 TaxID=3365668 RepID=UPI0037A31B60
PAPAPALAKKKASPTPPVPHISAMLPAETVEKELPATGTPVDLTDFEEGSLEHYSTNRPASPDGWDHRKPVAALPSWSTTVVKATYVLHHGDSLGSNRMHIRMRHDGNLVITDENEAVRWSSHTQGKGNHAVFHPDGRLVVLDKDNQTVWSSGVGGSAGAKLIIHRSGDVTVTSASGSVLWSAGTSH